MNTKNNNGKKANRQTNIIDCLAIRAKNINKNTYYMLSPLMMHLCHSVGRATSGKYKLTKKDELNGYYVDFLECNILLKVPFSALFNTNNKLSGVLSFSFNSVKYCPSERAGLCQLCDKNLCYAHRDEARSSKTTTKNGFKCMNSYFNGVLSRKMINKIMAHKIYYRLFINYLKTLNIEAIRFNAKSDFETLKDYKFILNLCDELPNIKFYGYTANDILFNSFNASTMPANFYLNGSNKKYTNRFKTETDLFNHLTSQYKCLGKCSQCKKCYTLNNVKISCLLHGTLTNIDKYFNTKNNRAFIIDAFARAGITIKNSDLLKYSGLLTSLNYALKPHGIEFKNYKELLDSDLIKNFIEVA